MSEAVAILAGNSGKHPRLEAPEVVVTWEAAPSPRPQSSAERSRALAARAEADAGIALARFEALHRARDGHRRRLALQPLGADPAAAAPPGWAQDRSGMLVTAGSTAQPLTPAHAERERGRLLWIALGKIVAALFAAAIGVGIGVTILSGMAG